MTEASSRSHDNRESESKYEHSLTQEQYQYLQDFLTLANGIYNNAKNTHPYIRIGADQAESILKPVTDRIATYSEPIVARFDSRLDRWIHKGQKVMHKDKLTAEDCQLLYVSGLQVWIKGKIEFPEFYTKIREIFGKPLSDEAYALVEKMFKDWENIQIMEVALLTALSVIQGNSELKEVACQVWYELKQQDQQLFIKEVKNRISISSEQEDQVKLFHSIVKYEEAIKAGTAANNIKALSKISKAKQVMEQTSYLLIGSADELYDWSVVTLDSQVVGRFVKPSQQEMQLVGTERLMAMNRRIGRSIRNAVRAQTDYLTNTRPVLYISTSYEQLLNTYKEYRDMDRKQLMKKQWPEDIRKRLDGLLKFVRLEEIRQRMEEEFWKNLDQDEDGVITVEDVCESFDKVKETDRYKKMEKRYRDFVNRIRHVIYGEEEQREEKRSGVTIEVVA